jgi:hypothetical protein
MYASTSAQFDNLTLANFLCAELGFFGPMTETLRQTHLLKGAGLSVLLLLSSLFIPNCKAGALDL